MRRVLCCFVIRKPEPGRAATRPHVSWPQASALAAMHKMNEAAVV